MVSVYMCAYTCSRVYSKRVVHVCDVCMCSCVLCLYVHVCIGVVCVYFIVLCIYFTVLCVCLRARVHTCIFAYSCSMLVLCVMNVLCAGVCVTLIVQVFLLTLHQFSQLY